MRSNNSACEMQHFALQAHQGGGERARRAGTQVGPRDLGGATVTGPRTRTRQPCAGQ